MSPRAIDTATGQAHERRGRHLLEAFASRMQCTFVPTPPTVTAPVDGIFVRRGTIVAVAEAKTRSTYDLPTIQQYGTYLVTADKLEQLVTAGGLLGVPSFLVLELSDAARWYWHVGTPHGVPAFAWPTRATSTQATSLGPETVTRVNAYLPLAIGVQWGEPLVARHA